MFKVQVILWIGRVRMQKETEESEHDMYLKQNFLIS